MGSNVGSAYVVIRADLDELKKGLAEAQSDIKKIAKAMQVDLDKVTPEKARTAWQKFASQMKSDARVLSKELSGVGSSIERFRGILLSIASIYTIRRLSTEFLEAGLQAQRMEVSLQAALGGYEAMTRAQTFLRAESQKLGLVFVDQVQGYARLAASARAANLSSEQTQKVYLGIARAATAMKLSQEGAVGVLRAFEQILSKGIVGAEEIRLQLGDRIPAAVTDAARAMNMTTQEFERMLRTGQILANDLVPRLADLWSKKYGPAAELAADQTQAAINRLSNAWFEFRRRIMESGVLDAVTEQLSKLTGAMTKWLETNDAFIKQDVPKYLETFRGKVESLYNQVTSNKEIFEYGLLGLIAHGRKGLVEGAVAGVVVKEASDWAKVYYSMSADVVSWKDVVKAAYEEVVNAILRLTAPGSGVRLGGGVSGLVEEIDRALAKGNELQLKLDKMRERQLEIIEEMNTVARPLSVQALTGNLPEANKRRLAELQQEYDGLERAITMTNDTLEKEQRIADTLTFSKLQEGLAATAAKFQDVHDAAMSAMMAMQDPSATAFDPGHELLLATSAAEKLAEKILLTSHDVERMGIRQDVFNKLVAAGVKAYEAYKLPMDNIVSNQQVGSLVMAQMRAVLSDVLDYYKAIEDASKESVEALDSLLKQTDLEKLLGDPDKIKKMLDEMRDAHARLKNDLYITDEEADAYWKNLIDGNKRAYDKIKKDQEDAAEEARKAQEKAQEEARKQYEHFLERVQDATADTFYDIFTDQLNSWEDFLTRMKDLFLRTLSEMLAAAIAKPIIVPIVASVTSAMGLTDVANAATGGGTGLGGIGSIVGGALNTPLWTSQGALPTTYDAATGLPMYIQSSAPGMTIGSALGYGAAGMMGYGTVGSWLGLPQGGYSGIGAGVGAAGGAATAGALMGSFAPGVGTAIGAGVGALVGGLGGSMIGGGERRAKLELGAGSQVQPGRPSVSTPFGPLGIDMASVIDTDALKPLMESVAGAAKALASTMSDSMVSSIKESMSDWSSEKIRGEMSDRDIGGLFVDYLATIGASMNSEFGTWIANFNGNLDDLISGITAHVNVMKQVEAILDPGGYAIGQIKSQFADMRDILEETGGSAEEFAKLERAKGITLQAEYQRQADAAARAAEAAAREAEAAAAAYQALIDSLMDSWIATNQYGGSLSDLDIALYNIDKQFAAIRDTLEEAGLWSKYAAEWEKRLTTAKQMAVEADKEATYQLWLSNQQSVMGLPGVNQVGIAQSMIAERFGMDIGQVTEEWGRSLMKWVSQLRDIDELQPVLDELGMELGEFETWVGIVSGALGVLDQAAQDAADAISNAAAAALEASNRYATSALAAGQPQFIADQLYFLQQYGMNLTRETAGQLYSWFQTNFADMDILQATADLYTSGDIDLLIEEFGRLGGAITSYDEYLTNLSQSTLDTSRALDDLNRTLEQLADQWGRLAESVQGDIDRARFSLTNPQSALERIGLVRAEIAALGDITTPEEGEKARELYNTLLDLGKEAYQRPTIEYQQIYDEAITGLTGIKTTAEDKQLEYLRQIRDNTSATATNTGNFATSGGINTVNINGSLDDLAGRFDAWKLPDLSSITKADIYATGGVAVHDATKANLYLSSSGIVVTDATNAAVYGEKVYQMTGADSRSVYTPPSTTPQWIKDLYEPPENLVDWNALKGLQHGGIVSMPTIAHVAEAGPEAVIPLQNGAVPVRITGDVGGDTIIHISVQVDGGNGNPSDIQRKTRQGVIDALKTPEAQAIIKRQTRWAT